MGNLHIVGPNEAVIVSGGYGKNREKKTVTGGWIWAWSGVTNVQKLSLGLMTLIPQCEDVETLHGVPLTVSGVAQCKVMKEAEFLRIAAEQFLGKSAKQIETTVRMTLEGHFRAILGTLTVEEVYKDRDKFASLVWEVAAPDVAKMGIQILSFIIRDVYDNVQYLSSLGRARTAVAKKEADIGVAEAHRDAGIKESKCEKLSMDVKYDMSSKIEDHSRRYELQKSTFDQEVNTAKAEARLAYDLQAARIRQSIRKEEMQIEVIERAKEIEIEEEEVRRKELELNATVRLPAEAEGYRMGLISEGLRTQTLETGRAEGEMIKLVGLAEAKRMSDMGQAEAEMMMKRAAAFQKYGETAVAAQIAEALPKIAAQVSAPLARIEDIFLLGGNDQLTSEANRLVSQLSPSLNALTGIDLKKFLRKTTLTKYQETM